MLKLAGLFVLVVALVMWVLLASALLDGVRNGQHASVLETVTATATAPVLAATARPTPLANLVRTATPTATPTPAAQTYTVASGDNLTKIARRFGVTVQALEQANHITDPTALRAGQTIEIPGP